MRVVIGLFDSVKIGCRWRWQQTSCGAILQSKFHFQFVLATLIFDCTYTSRAFEFVDVLFEAMNESTNTKFHVKLEIIPKCFGCPCRLRWRKPNRSHKFNLQNDKIGRTACGQYNLIEIQGDISVIGMKNEFLLTNCFNFMLTTSSSSSLQLRHLA